MRIGPIADGLREWLAIRLRLGPRPLIETHGTLLLAQAVMVGTKLGVFEALTRGPLSAAEIAGCCGTDKSATEKLLAVLVATGYVLATGDGRLELMPDARRWLAEDSPTSLRDNVLFRFVEWDWIGRLEGFVATGVPLDIHREMSGDQWTAYQRGMRSLAGAWVREVAWRTPVPRGARALLDVGGSHGLYSAALCRRHKEMRAVVLDLPAAVEPAAALLDGERMGARVTYRAGDARSCDLGVESFDIVFISNLLHHFEREENRDVIRRAARALRPGGVLVVQELFALAPRARAGQVMALAELYFALTSRSGALSVGDVVTWQEEAGLKPRRPIRFASFPGAGQQNAVKPE